jgi:O-methyltransferase
MGYFSGMKKLINKMLRFWGVELKKYPKMPKDRPQFWSDLNPNLSYDYNSEAIEAIRIVRKQTMLPYVNLETLYEQAVYCERNEVAGDFVECGVWKGGAMGLMALANFKYGVTRRNLHLFDIFDDICEPNPLLDGEKTIMEFQKLTGIKQGYSGKLVPVKGVYKLFGGPGNLEENMDLFEKIIKYPKEYIHYHVGWFQNTLPLDEKSIKQIAILRLDGDLYASIKVCINVLYDKVVIGGIIIVDDYGTYEGCRKAIDEFVLERNIKVFLNYSNAFCGYWIKQ